MKAYLYLGAMALSLTQAPAVFAQGCGPGGCGAPMAGHGGCLHGRSDCGWCGLKSNPLSEKRYIKQFCKPTISPDSCFGYFKTQWTPWNNACPNWGPDLPHPGPYMFSRTGATAPVEAPREIPKDVTPPQKEPVKPMNPETAPNPMVKPMDPKDTTFPKPPTIPSTPLPNPKETKEPKDSGKPPTFPPPVPMDNLPKPPTVPSKPVEPAKEPMKEVKDLPKLPEVPKIPGSIGTELPSIPTVSRPPF